jgi:hypothetical protein
MREIRKSGSEGGGTEPNRPSLPLSSARPEGRADRATRPYRPTDFRVVHTPSEGSQPSTFPRLPIANRR